jgi:hypothetical protein
MFYTAQNEPFYILSESNENFKFSIFSQNLFYNYSHLSGCEVVSPVLISNDTEHLFKCLLVSSSFLEKCLFKSFANFLVVLFFSY